MNTWWNPSFVPPDLRKRVVDAYIDYLDGYSNENSFSIANRFEVGITGIYRWYDTFIETGEIWTAKEAAQRNGVYVRPYPNKRLSSSLANKALYAALSDSSVSILKEYQENLLNVGILASIPTIHRFWDSKHVSRKKCSIYAKESNWMDVLDFWELCHWYVDDVEQLLFGDESHRNDHSSTRQYGRAHTFVIIALFTFLLDLQQSIQIKYTFGNV